MARGMPLNMRYFIYSKIMQQSQNLRIDEILMVPSIHTKLSENSTILTMDLVLSWNIPGDSAGQLISLLRSSTQLKSSILILTPYEYPELNRLRIEAIEAIVNDST
ncbi:6630_t:CDS:1 [Gigaspora margarita]|uniref:6630_t:CDS:1 n=1 Tax=Gigaspora margarita TaxID=4874 RepID=A0ABN7VAD5_GIGMA|nr:6630_t:CDS:1 [Gigaspora margarita]